MIVWFPGTEQSALAEVGGKGRSLIRLAAAGLPVPPGAVLTAEFFEPWLDEVRASEAWAALGGAPPERWRTLCRELKARCAALAPTAAQARALAELREGLAARGHGALWAVRSSSPEEDLEAASFAGGYETRLGVRGAELEGAVRHCFASSLDERVLVYKREHGLDVTAPRMAVVVQQQVDAEVAGVGFSLNPVTNDFDEAVVDANWGLGESVVGGRASPDHFVIDKVGRRVVARKLGAKQVSIWLDRDGGTVERAAHRSDELTLDDDRLAELTDLMCRVEALDGAPTDLEWAYAGSRLHVLQARPITRYVPLPPEMITGPGERRRLYIDTALSDGLTLNEPISPMGLDWMDDLQAFLFERIIGPASRGLTGRDGLAFAAGSRLYMNVSNLLWVTTPQAMAVRAGLLNTVMAEILAGIDAERYRAPARPSWARLRSLWMIPRALWGLRGFLATTLWSLLAPERGWRAYETRVADLERELREVDGDLPLAELRRRLAPTATRLLLDVTMPVLVAFFAALSAVDALVRGDPERADTLKRGFTGNVVVEMGIALFRMARLLDRSDLDDLSALAERVDAREMPAEFMAAWDAFVARFGWRGPLEMDLASPRYGDDPRLALRQMSFMSVDDAGFDPEVAHDRQVDERRRACAELMRRSGPVRRALLRRVDTVIERFAGTRDAPKHYLVWVNYAVRRRVLVEGRRLVREGRLDAPGDVFGLTFADLEAAARDPSLDLRQLRAERTRFHRVLEAQVTEFPHAIDSRGRILRPPAREETPGELRGTAVSPGVVNGPVVILRDPHDKPVRKGDVLVAYTTDPGWTPLFVNAAAIVLEVGGVLQHGAVVAREFGKPCVAGIDRVLDRLHDGQQVEVDGAAGVVRLVE